MELKATGRGAHPLACTVELSIKLLVLTRKKYRPCREMLERGSGSFGFASWAHNLSARMELRLKRGDAPIDGSIDRTQGYIMMPRPYYGTVLARG